MRKIYMLIGIIILSFLLFLYIINKSKNYTIKYKVNDFDVEESYNKDHYGYFISVKYDDFNYPIYLQNRYTKKRKLVSNVKINEEEDKICIEIDAINKKNIICSIDNKLMSLNSMPSDYLKKYYPETIVVKDKQSSYKQITIYNQEVNYLIWNYKGFYRLSKKDSEEIKIFKKDNYKNNLSYQTSDYLLFPDYDEEYYFKKLYIYDMKNNLLNDVNFYDEISYESYFIGSYKNKVYLLDKKNKAEYEIDLKRNNLVQVSKDGFGVYYDGNGLEKIQISKMINNQLKFKSSNAYDYKIDNSNLYLTINNYDILIDSNIKDIIHVNNDKVYYLVEDELYMYEYSTKKTLLLKNKEWNFNYDNQIFLF